MDYRDLLAAIRAAREARRLTQRETRRFLRVLRQVRDAEIRRLAGNGMHRREIAAIVGCSEATVYEVLNPERQVAYNRRRAKHSEQLRAATRRERSENSQSPESTVTAGNSVPQDRRRFGQPAPALPGAAL